MKSKIDQIWDDIALLQGLRQAAIYRNDELALKYKAMASARIAELFDEIRELNGPETTVFHEGEGKELPKEEATGSCSSEKRASTIIGETLIRAAERYVSKGGSETE